MGWGGTAILCVVERLVGGGGGETQKSDRNVGSETELQIIKIAILTEIQPHNPLSKFQNPKAQNSGFSHNLLRSSKPDLT